MHLTSFFRTYNLYCYWLSDWNPSIEKVWEQNVLLFIFTSKNDTKRSTLLLYKYGKDSDVKGQNSQPEGLTSCRGQAFVSLLASELFFFAEKQIIRTRTAAAASRRGLTGMVKPINERYCILASPASLGMHVCMLNIWICIGIEHLLPELATSQHCAWNNNNPADKRTAFFFPVFFLSACHRVIEKDNKRFNLNFIAQLTLNVNLCRAELQASERIISLADICPCD